MSEEDPKKELATLKRKASEIASKMHDIVEDTFWSDTTIGGGAYRGLRKVYSV